MTETTNLLIEIGTEELPPGTIGGLSGALRDNLLGELKDLGFPEVGDVNSYFTPRRLAVILSAIPTRQPDRVQERLGPPVAASFDSEGLPTKTANGFAKSCGVTVDQLEQVESNKGPRLAFRSEVVGRPLTDLLEGAIANAVNDLPIAKPMRWGSNTASFIRPVHWFIVMLNRSVVPARCFGLASGRRSRGHRVHHPEWIEIQGADEYVKQLREGYVLVDAQERKARIREQVDAVGKQHGATPVVPEGLLDEVCNLVEWPVAMMGHFEDSFLQVPEEAIVSSLQSHQKMFPVRDSTGSLAPTFITIANLESTSPDEVRQGYERVVKPRLADAHFFWSKDLQIPLLDHRKSLDAMTFQKDLGSLGDKIDRMGRLAAVVAERLQLDEMVLKRAVSLCKCDLLTDMVGEFPDLQGIMGARYATAQGEDKDVALAIEQHYRPRFAGDAIADSLPGLAVSLVDRIDSIAGIFSAGLKPTGNKDPFALRRGSLGVVRTVVEGKLDLDLEWLMQHAVNALPGELSKVDSVAEIMSFVWERARGYFADTGVSGDVFDAVLAVQTNNLLDFSRRASACQAFSDSESAASLAAANKRVGNMLKKTKGGSSTAAVDAALLKEPAEAELFAAIQDRTDAVQIAVAKLDYGRALRELSELRPQIDRFFDDVLIMDDDPAVRGNRLCLLEQMRNLFLMVADVGLLSQ